MIILFHHSHHQETSTGNRKWAIWDNWSRCDPSVYNQLRLKQNKVNDNDDDVDGDDDDGDIIIAQDCLAAKVSIWPPATWRLFKEDERCHQVLLEKVIMSMLLILLMNMVTKSIWRRLMLIIEMILYWSSFMSISVYFPPPTTFNVSLCLLSHNFWWQPYQLDIENLMFFCCFYDQNSDKRVSCWFGT